MNMDSDLWKKARDFANQAKGMSYDDAKKFLEEKKKEINSIMEMRAKMRGIVNTLADITNNMTLDYDAAADVLEKAFRNTDRTLQQSTMKLLAEFITNVAKTEDTGIDLRNEGAIAWAKEVAKIEKTFPNI
jgi:ribosomal protein L22